MVKVSEVLVFNAMGLAPKTLAIDGGVLTVNVAVFEVVPVPPFVALTAPVVLL